MEEKYERFIIKDYKNWTLFLHDKQYYLGRTYIWSKREGSLDFMQMTDDEKSELFVIGNSLNKALSKLFEPNLMNYASLANITRHLHVHIIPRYSSPRTFDGIQFVDGNWGKNAWPYNRNFKIPEETLLKIRDAIKEKLE